MSGGVNPVERSPAQDMETGKKGRYVWMIVFQSILYGLMDVAAKQAYRVMPVYSFLFLRYALAAFIMFAVWHRTILRDVRSVPVKNYIVPGLCLSLAILLSNLALSFTAATNMSFIRSLSAVIVPALALIFFKQRYAKAEIILQPFLLAGLYLLCARGGLSRFGAGEILAFMSAALMAGSLVFGHRSLQCAGAASLSFVQASLSIVLCGVLTVMIGTAGELVHVFDGRILFSLFYIASGTVGGYMLQNMALKHISAKTVGVAQCLYPIATAMFAYAILHERLSPAGIAGAAILLVCIVLENIFIKE